MPVGGAGPKSKFAGAGGATATGCGPESLVAAGAGSELPQKYQLTPPITSSPNSIPIATAIPFPEFFGFRLLTIFFRRPVDIATVPF